MGWERAGKRGREREERGGDAEREGDIEGGCERTHSIHVQTSVCMHKMGASSESINAELRKAIRDARMSIDGRPIPLPVWVSLVSFSVFPRAQGNDGKEIL